MVFTLFLTQRLPDRYTSSPIPTTKVDPKDILWEGHNTAFLGIYYLADSKIPTQGKQHGCPSVIEIGEACQKAVHFSGGSQTAFIQGFGCSGRVEIASIFQEGQGDRLVRREELDPDRYVPTGFHTANGRFTVALQGMEISHGQEGALHSHRQINRRAGPQVIDIQIAAMGAGGLSRNGAMFRTCADDPDHGIHRQADSMVESDIPIFDGKPSAMAAGDLVNALAFPDTHDPVVY